jgi:hypothetical protein
MAQLGGVLQQLRFTAASGQGANHIPHGQLRAMHARLYESHRRIDGDAIEIILLPSREQCKLTTADLNYSESFHQLVPSRTGAVPPLQPHIQCSTQVELMSSEMNMLMIGLAEDNQCTKDAYINHLPFQEAFRHVNLYCKPAAICSVAAKVSNND